MEGPRKQADKHRRIVMVGEESRSKAVPFVTEHDVVHDDKDVEVQSPPPRQNVGGVMVHTRGTNGSGPIAEDQSGPSMIPTLGST